MLPFDIALAFFGIAVLLALTPGPDNIFVIMQSAMAGARSGFQVVLGLCTGLIGHTLAVALGLAALLAASATAFVILKAAGAAYLAYLGWCALRDSGRAGNDTPETVRLGGWALYRRGIVMNVTNPKVSLFFLAFLPQFTSAARGPVALQTLVLGALFILATFIVFGALAWLAGSLGTRMQGTKKTRQWLNRLAGVVFIGLAVRLALADR